MKSAPFITSQTVLIQGNMAAISCPLCAKIAAACDGQRPLREVAQVIYLPLAVCQSLVQKALDNQWLRLREAAPVITNTESFWQELDQALGQVMGQQGETLMQRAAQMTGQEAGDVAGEAIPDFLIAVEMYLPEAQRFELVEALDSLRNKYGLPA